MQNLLQAKNQDLNLQLEKDGVVVVDFLNAEELQAARAIYQKNKSSIDQYAYNGIHMTNWMPRIDAKYNTLQELNDLLQKPAQRLFQDSRLLNTVFIIKNKHKVSDFPLHQDWSFVDETRFPSLNIWIALQDTDLHNGGLSVIKGSHKLGNTMRGAGKLSFDFSKYGKKLRSYLSPVKATAGQAILFYHALIHGSPPNLSSEPRAIIAASAIPATADLLVNHYDEKTETLLKFRMPDNFNSDYDDIRTESISTLPKGELVESVASFHPQDISLEKIQSISIKPKNSWIDTIRNLFN